MGPKPVLAVVANVERLKKDEDRQLGDASTKVDFYMKQKSDLDNACGVIACLHAIYNNSNTRKPNDIPIDADSILGQHWKNITTSSPEDRAVALASNRGFQRVHQKRASEGDSIQATEQSEVKHHYVTFTLSEGRLVELDGRKQGPHVVKEGCTDVLKDTIDVIKRRLDNQYYTESMNLMALCT